MKTKEWFKIGFGLTLGYYVAKGLCEDIEYFTKRFCEDSGLSKRAAKYVDERRKEKGLEPKYEKETKEEIPMGFHV